MPATQPLIKTSSNAGSIPNMYCASGPSAVSVDSKCRSASSSLPREAISKAVSALLRSLIVNQNFLSALTIGDRFGAHPEVGNGSEPDTSARLNERQLTGWDELPSNGRDGRISVISELAALKFSSALSS